MRQKTKFISIFFLFLILCSSFILLLQFQFIPESNSNLEIKKNTIDYFYKGEYANPDDANWYLWYLISGYCSQFQRYPGPPAPTWGRVHASPYRNFTTTNIEDIAEIGFPLFESAHISSIYINFMLRAITGAPGGSATGGTVYFKLYLNYTSGADDLIYSVTEALTYDVWYAPSSVELNTTTIDQTRELYNIYWDVDGQLNQANKTMLCRVVIYDFIIKGYIPVIENISIPASTLDLNDSFYIYCNTLNFSNLIAQYTFTETGNAINRTMKSLWYYDNFYYDYYSFIYYGTYTVQIIAINEFNYSVSSLVYSILITEILFPQPSYLNVRAYEYRDVPEELFYIYLGLDEQTMLFDFEDLQMRGDWVGFGDISAYYTPISLTFNTSTGGGMKSDFDHIFPGVGYYTENLTLIIELRTTTNRTAIILNPDSYDADYLLQLNSTYINRWLEVHIPFYMFQNFPSHDGIIDGLGFYAFSGELELYKIKIANWHFSTFIINFTEQNFETTGYSTLNDSYRKELLNFSDITPSSATACWTNTSESVFKEYNYSCNELNTSEYQTFGETLHVNEYTWNNQSYSIEKTYNYNCSTEMNYTYSENNETNNPTNTEWNNETFNQFYNTSTDFNNYTTNNCTINDNLTLKEIGISFDFTDDTIGADPDGFVITEESNTNITVDQQVGSQRNVMQFNDTHVSYLCQGIQYFNQTRSTDGDTISFWARVDAAKWFYIGFKDNASSKEFGMLRFWPSPQKLAWTCWIGSWNTYDLIASYELNKWYYFELSFDFTNKKVDITINDTIISSVQCSTVASNAQLEKITIQTYPDSIMNAYVNAIDYSWDTNYFSNRSRYFYDQKYYLNSIWTSKSINLSITDPIYDDLIFHKSSNENTSVYLSYRESLDNSSWDSWTEFTSSNITIGTVSKQFIQFQALLNTSNTIQTPVLYWINFTYTNSTLINCTIDFNNSLVFDYVNKSFITDYMVNTTVCNISHHVSYEYGVHEGYANPPYYNDTENFYTNNLNFYRFGLYDPDYLQLEYNLTNYTSDFLYLDYRIRDIYGSDAYSMTPILNGSIEVYNYTSSEFEVFEVLICDTEWFIDYLQVPTNYINTDGNFTIRINASQYYYYNYFTQYDIYYFVITENPAFLYNFTSSNFDIILTKNLFSLYNRPSLSDYSKFPNYIEDIFNTTHIKYKINITKSTIFNINYSIEGNITYFYYINSSFTDYLDLSNSILYFHNNFTLNSTGDCSFKYYNSTDNNTWSSEKTDLVINEYSTQYLKIALILNTTDKFSTPYFFNLTFYYNLENITDYTINYTGALPFSTINTSFIYAMNVSISSNTSGILYLYNYSTSAYEFEITTYNNTLSAVIDAFNSTHILYIVNATKKYNFSMIYQVNANISFSYYSNIAYYNYFDLNVSTMYFYYNFTTNNESETSLHYFTSNDNSTWSIKNSDLLIDEYNNRYLKIRIDCNTTNRFITNYFYNFTFNYRLDNITCYQYFTNFSSSFMYLPSILYYNHSINLDISYTATSYINSSVYIYNHTDSSWSANQSSIPPGNSILYLTLNQNTSSVVNVSILIYQYDNFSVSFNSFYTNLTYHNFTRSLSITYILALSIYEELSMWYNFDNPKATISLSFYNESGYFNQAEMTYCTQEVSYYGAVSTRYNQYWQNITLDDSFYKIKLTFTLNNPDNLTETETFYIKRFELIDLSTYRLESEQNRQRYNILFFDYENETLLLIDNFGRDIYRNELEYSLFIDIYLNIAEITLTNELNNQTIWFEFELGPESSIVYGVPASTSRSIYMLFGDYLVKIYNNLTILDVREISIVNSSKHSVVYEDTTDISDDVTYPWWHTGIIFFDGLIEAFIALFTTYFWPWGLIVILIITIWITYKVLRWKWNRDVKKLRKWRKYENSKKSVRGF